MSEFSIRPATEADIPDAAASVTGLFREDAGTRDATMSQDWPLHHAAEALAADIADPEKTLFVADADGEIVGHLRGYVSMPSEVRPIRVATLLSMYVLPHHRSAGVGARLVAAVRGWAREHAADRLAVSAYAANESAIRFYERNGFAARTVVLETVV
jgi:GNAT superfamily N-acetyltransferase